MRIWHAVQGASNQPVQPVDLSLCLQLYDLASDSEDFQNFLTDPLIPKSQRMKALDSILDGQGVHELTKSFLGEAAATILGSICDKQMDPSCAS